VGDFVGKWRARDFSLDISAKGDVELSEFTRNSVDDVVVFTGKGFVQAADSGYGKTTSTIGHVLTRSHW
jgi:hypothetical protein